MEVGDQSDERDPEQGVERRIREIPDEPDPDRFADHPANGLSKRVSSLLDDDSVDEDDSRRHIARGESAGQVSAEQLAENLSTEAAEALSEAEAEIDEYKSNVLYDAHPDETSFEWVADDDVTSKWSSS